MTSRYNCEAVKAGQKHMIEDATKPLTESFEMYDDESDAQPFSIERAEQPVTLNLKEAAFALGKSMRALERSLTGKWGNKLPDGWTARKVIIDDQEEWQITPPPSFHVDAELKRSEGIDGAERTYKSNQSYKSDRSENSKPSEYSIEGSLIPALTKAANRFQIGKPIELHLLRELAATHKELSEERRAHVEDLKLLTELQSSMRLLENRASETALLKTELIEAQKDLVSLKNQYQELLNMPWWKRIFVKK